jgi:2-polyprenyl-3-methyl-5-hydroxy-6-metoxy-1,4-benzoquinol methylase
MDGWNGERQIGKKIEEIEEKHVERYRFAQKYCTNKNVLDAACGCGYGSNILSQNARSILAVDISNDAIDYAKNHWNRQNISFKTCDLNSDISNLGKFDVIVSFETIEHLDASINQTLEKFYGILNQGGVMIISHPEKEKNLNPVDVSESRKKILVKRILFQMKEMFTIDTKNPDGLKNFHKHFEIDGIDVRKKLEQMDINILVDCHQPGRFDTPYHIIVGEKR